MHPLKQIIKANKENHKEGIYSCCSANKYVLRAALERGRETNTHVLIEATANQVNQYGGYMGMTPKDFYDYVKNLAANCGLPYDKLIMGGDHLGPLTFASLAEDEAMKKAVELVEAYVAAGYTKIHLDTSMYLASDDKTKPLPVETVALRGARLCKACERAHERLRKSNPDAMEVVYIIGSEVPIPGGAQEKETEISVTTKESALETIRAYEECFAVNDLMDAWQRVVGLVVQPGVEFGDDSVFEYNSKAVVKLKEALCNEPQITFEAHSTDYQTRYALRAMVEDGFSILKVGPGLTFALREALFALDGMESELSRLHQFEPSGFRKALEKEMHINPDQWINHYHGGDSALYFKRSYSFSDRARYYLQNNNVDKALSTMLLNLNTYGIPLSLLSQFMPVQYERVREHKLEIQPDDLILDKIKECIDEYLYATTGSMKDEDKSKDVS